MRTFWSSFGELDNLLNKSPEEKREILKDWYDPDMIDKLEDDQLDEVISDDPTIYDDAARDFEDEIAPMISSQVRNGLIFDEKFNLIDPVKLLDFDGYSAELDEDEVGDLSFNVEGRKAFPLYGFSEDDNEFIEQLRGLGVLDTLHNLYPDMDDEDFDDPYYWEDLIPFDWEMLGQNLTHVKDLGNLGESCDEQLDEAKAKNPTKLADELEEIKDLSDEYGREYFTQMPFTSFDNDPISIEMQYPEFFRIVKAFFKEMEILSPEELNDPDELDVQWDQGIDKHDWDVLMKVCDKLAKGKGAQIEKEYKTGYNSPLDDDEILANREEESLEEEVINEARKYEVDNNFVYIGTGDDQSDIGEIWDDGTLELYHPEKFDAKERARMQKDLKDYNISFLDESLIEDVDMGKVNAQKFMKYLKDHNVASGYMAEKEPEMTAEMGEQPYYLVHLYSQTSDLEVYFNEDGTIRWHEEFDEGSVKDGGDTIVIEDFANWKEMTDWMKDEHWFWSEDWGADLPEDLNEDTVTWPWGDPNLELPRKEEKIIDDSSLDNMID